jgi:hypothetical protein
MASHKNEFITSTGVRWDDPEEGKTWLVSLVGIITLAALVVALSIIYFRGEESEMDVKVVDAAYTSLLAQKEAQKDLLMKSGPYEVSIGDKDQKLVRQRVAIGEAMKSVVANPKLVVPPAGSAPAAAPASGGRASGK